MRYEDHGSLTLKGFAEPVAVVRVAPDGVDAVERLRPFGTAPSPAPGPVWRRADAIPIALAIALVAISIPLLRFGDGTIDIGTNSVALINAEDGSLELATTLGQRPGASVIGFGSLWIAEPDRGVVARLNLKDGSVTDTVRVGNAPGGIAIGEGSVWVTNAADGTVSRISPDTNEETEVIEVGSGRPASPTARVLCESRTRSAPSSSRWIRRRARLTPWRSPVSHPA
ncbi:MAG: hypothetical protein M3456_10850 [Actinomycetota bacterium]|nr:hypothetical protein [Actinomycetota bacterium]